MKPVSLGFILVVGLMCAALVAFGVATVTGANKSDRPAGFYEMPPGWSKTPPGVTVP